MTAKSRMSSEQRRQSIVEMSVPLFAQKGFSSTTTRELAEVAGVSEALLYRHFPSKKDLYTYIQKHCCENLEEDLKWIDDMPVSVDALVQCVYILLDRMLVKVFEDDSNSYYLFSRLMFNSLLEDGEFAKLFMESSCVIWINKVEACIKQAVKDGHMKPLESANSAAWLVHHVGIGAIIMNMPSTRVIDYDLDRQAFVHNTAVFALRGLGLKEELIPTEPIVIDQ